uniref:Uncharacterized protein n=1 Tax=Romanomermis culicivorax TaxID=13658 RepID=A0A915HXE8_ROMCU
MRVEAVYDKFWGQGQWTICGKLWAELDLGTGFDTYPTPMIRHRHQCGVSCWYFSLDTFQCGQEFVDPFLGLTLRSSKR